MLEDNITKIVLTGGPCAGKSTIFDELEKDLVSKGYYVITVTETATELINSKILPKPSDREHTIMFQDIVLQQQYTKEKVAEIFAKKMAENNKVVILYDRAVIDNRAYLESKEDFDYILKKHNLDEFEILNKYDLVIDLISTATSQPENYKLNGVRYETVEEAAELDKRTSIAWIHHPNIKIIKPTETIEEKKDTVIKIVEDYLNEQDYSDKSITVLDEQIDIEEYNDNNSKTVYISNIYLDNDLVLTRKQYYDSCVYTISQLSKMNRQKIINQKEFVNLIYSNHIVFIENKKEINFIEKGNPYKIIECDNEFYIETEKNDVFNFEQAFVKIK